MTAVLVVGWSLGGLSTATALRKFGHRGPIAVLAAEPAPYDRPPLSKKYLGGSVSADGLLLSSSARVRDLGVQVHGGRSAVSLDLARRRVTDDRGVVHAFDHLVIATGVRPRVLPALDATRAHYLRTRADSDRLREALDEHTRLLIIGAGFLGLEVAATASRICRSVVVVEQHALPLEERLGVHAARRVLALHRARGVDIRAGVGVVRVGPKDGATTLELTDGATVEADVVVVAIGAVPNTEWATGPGIDLRDGVECDQSLSAAEGVWAVGDVARWPHRRYGRNLRLEHRQNAVDQGRHVARALCGDIGPFSPVPYFWTDQFDMRVQVAGLVGGEPDEGESVADGRGFVKHFSSGGELVGVVAVNAPREFVSERVRLEERARR